VGVICCFSNTHSLGKVSKEMFIAVTTSLNYTEFKVQWHFKYVEEKKKALLVQCYANLCKTRLEPMQNLGAGTLKIYCL
jgi:hypothetical protein